MALIGIDYGDKHCGLALGQSSFAAPLETVLTSSAIGFIRTLLSQYQVEAFVLGLSEGVMAGKTQAFGKLLENTFHLPVFYQDETLSSQETRLHLARHGTKKSKREQKIDHIVAANILQEYLNDHSGA